MAHADTNEQPVQRMDYGFEVQRYTWEEFNIDNSRLLEEKGYLYGLTCDYDSGRNILGWRSGGSLFLGQVDYDGHSWSLAPVKTDVFYVVTQDYLDIVPNYRFDFGLRIFAFAGIGFRGWLRDLADTKTADGALVSGAEEWWWSLYGRVGAGAAYPVTADIEVFSEAGVKLPIYAENDGYFYLAGNPSVRLRQQQDYSPFGSIGVRWKKLSVKLAYDSLRFKKSDSVTTGSYELYQPKSTADIFTLNAAWSLKF